MACSAEEWDRHTNHRFTLQNRIEVQQIITSTNCYYIIPAYYHAFRVAKTHPGMFFIAEQMAFVG